MKKKTSLKIMEISHITTDIQLYYPIYVSTIT